MKTAACISLLVGALLLAPATPSQAVRPAIQCTPQVGAAYAARVARVLGSGRDVWGDRLLAAKDGPTLAATSRLLPPLLYAAGHGGRRLTASGVYYLPFTLPVSVGGPRGFGLHVADGSQVIVRRAGGPSLTVAVGRGGSERYGSCLARLGTPTLGDGYLPILQVDYTDSDGVRYGQESFVGRLPGSRSLVSFVHLSADATGARATSAIRFVTSRGARVTRVVHAGSHAELDGAFVHDGARLRTIDADTYTAARATVAAYWQKALAAFPSFDIPEPKVMDAQRALLVQELELTWRYSVGNVYEELSYAEGLDVAEVMAAFGQRDVSRQILRYALRRLPIRFTNWRAGERLVAGAQYYALTHDARYVNEELPGLASVLARLERELAVGGNGLLARERYSSDIADQIYSLQGQTLVWQGLHGMSRVWSATGHPALARRGRTLALRLQTGLRRAIVASQRRLPDGSLFVPAALLDGGRPFDRLTSSVDGTYWNLVAPYALASGFFRPHGAQAAGLLRYLDRHGSRLAGLVRAGAYRLAAANTAVGAKEQVCVGGTDQVYGLNVSRFLADNDQADQLDLTLYGTLGVALTPGTYVSGEAASVTPLNGERYRTMYLPPNNDTPATFLETLRLMLVHESRGPEGEATGLELAFATPRSWLEDGKTIAVRNAPTTFGPLTYSITRSGTTVRFDVQAPPRATRSLRLRLRLPRGTAIRSVDVAGHPVRFDRATGTIDLPRAGATSGYAVVGSTM
jgi:hypothetical protein